MGDVRRNFEATALQLQRWFVYLKRICSTTENEPLNSLHTQHFFSLYLLPHLNQTSFECVLALLFIKLIQMNN